MVRSCAARSASCPCLLSILVLASYVAPAAADTHYVDPASPTPNEPYTTPQTAAHQIQPALEAAAEGDTVQLAAGTYKISSPLAINQAITVLGAGVEKTLFNAEGKCTVVHLGKGATLQRVTVTGGKAREAGGVRCGPGATLADCTITGNEAERYGGGVYARVEGRGKVSPAVVRNCKITGNRVTKAMHTDTPWGGGGVYAAGDVQVIDCLIEDNEAQQRAGGIWLHGGGTLAENCTIARNRALGKRARNSNGPGSMEEGGGGAYCDFGGQLRGCLITGNHAGKIGGGAVLSTNGRAKSCTIVENNAGLSGGGVQTLGPGHVVNSIVVGNTRGKNVAEGGQSDDVYISHYYHVDVHQLMLGKANLRHSCVGETKLHHTNQRFYLGPTARYDPKWYKNTLNETEPVAADPMFMDAAGGDYRLKAGSPCIDAGLNEDWMSDAQDLEGKPRIQGKAVDVGAYEFTGTAAGDEK